MDVEVTVQVKAGGGDVDLLGLAVLWVGVPGRELVQNEGIGEPSGKCRLRQLIAVFNSFVFDIFSLEPRIVYPLFFLFFLSEVQLI